MNLDVLGLGTAAMDVVLNCQDLPAEDSFSFVEKEALVPGGSCANFLVALTGLGFRAGLSAKLGDDHYGRAFLNDLAAGGVDVSGVVEKPGGVTLHTYITVAARGARSIFAHLGDSLLDLAAGEVDEAWLDGAKVFYTDLFPAAPAFKLARGAKKRGLPVVFNLEVPVGFMATCGIGEESIREMIGLADLFITSGGALAELSGQSDPALGLAELCRAHGPSQGAVATLGEEGALWQRADELLHQPAMPVAAVDTTGAGDAFAAGLVAGFFLLGRAPAYSLRLATACASAKCEQPGPRLSLTPQRAAELLG